MDYLQRNGRCFHNRISQVYNGISSQPVAGGPSWLPAQQRVECPDLVSRLLGISRCRAALDLELSLINARRAARRTLSSADGRREHAENQDQQIY